MFVPAADGNGIAVWVGGDGPPVVLVHGSLADHTTLDPLTEALQRRFTTYALDRRGFGATSDGKTPYSLDLDADDAVAVVDSVAAEAACSVVVFGHSYGANVAMAAAARSRSVSHAVLYEPSLGLAYAPGAIDRIERLIEAGERERAIVEMFQSVLELTEEEIDALRINNPLWPVRVAAAHTMPRECRVEDGWSYRPGQFASIGAPVMMLLGSESPADIVKATHAAADAVGGATIRVLEGHGHFAHKTEPGLVAALIAEFAAG